MNQNKISKKKIIFFNIVIFVIAFFFMESSLRLVNLIKEKKHHKHKIFISAVSMNKVEKKFIGLINAKLSLSNEITTTWDHDDTVRLSTDNYFVSNKYYKPKPNLSFLTIANSPIIGNRYGVVLTEEIRNLLPNIKGEMSIRNFDENSFRKTGNDFRHDVKRMNVLFLGDSFTEGVNVNDVDTFPSCFERLANRDGIDSAALNAGICGYSVKEEYYRTVELEGINTIPNIIVLNFFANDVYSNHHKVIGYYKPTEPINKIMKWLDGNILVAHAVIRGYYSLFCRPVDPGKTKVIEQGWNEAFTYLRKLDSYCRDHKIRLFVAVIPTKEQFNYPKENYYRKNYQEKLRAFCISNKIEFLDPFNIFLQKGIDNIYLAWDPHFSPDGHKTYAEFLYRYIFKKSSNSSE